MEMRRERESRKKAVIPKPLKGMPLKFDYKYLNSEEDHVYVKKKTNELRLMLDRRDKHVFEIGEILLAIKGRLPHKLFIPWIESELHISRDAAQRYMKVVKRFGEDASQLSYLSFMAVYALTLPSTPKDFVEKVRLGEIKLTGKAFWETMKTFKEQEPPIMIHGERVKPREITIQDLSDQLAKMQQQLSALPPEVQIKETIPPETQEEIKCLQNKVETLETAILEKDAKIEALQQEVEVLVKNWNAVSKRNGELEGKLKSLNYLIQRLNDEYSQIYQAGKPISASMIAYTPEGED